LVPTLGGKMNKMKENISENEWEKLWDKHKP
jgi:hypothetical protein